MKINKPVKIQLSAMAKGAIILSVRNQINDSCEQIINQVQLDPEVKFDNKKIFLRWLKIEKQIKNISEEIFLKVPVDSDLKKIFIRAGGKGVMQDYRKLEVYAKQITKEKVPDFLNEDKIYEFIRLMKEKQNKRKDNSNKQKEQRLIKAGITPAQNPKNNKLFVDLEWKNKTEMVELIFALSKSGRIRRNGKPIQQKELIEIFETLFNTDLKNFHDLLNAAKSSNKRNIDGNFFIKELYDHIEKYALPQKLIKG